MGADKVAEPCSLPVLLHHKILRFRQTLNALIKLLHELVDTCDLTRSLSRHPLHDSKLVLGAVGKLSHQERGVFLAALEL